MKISLNLLRQFTATELEESELLERISSRIGEIEAVTPLAPKYEGIVVGIIEAAQDHPDANKLGVYTVTVSVNRTVQVVAGDKKLKEGDRIAYIPPGVAVPATFDDEEPLVIAERDLRGQKSNGMLASAKELDLGDDHSGVLVLDTDQPAGTPFAPLYELDDTVIEIENKALTHRPDCFGHIGFAREVAGIQDIAFRSPEWFLTQEPRLEPAADDSFPIDAVNGVPELCHRLTVTGFNSVSVGQSPLKIRSYLQRLGIRPLNTVVDITNYLMLVTGQPLHAFDYDKLFERSGGDTVIHVRRAESGEIIKLLSGKTVKLTKDDMVIATDKTPVALAGVMGGAETEVDATTTRVVIEAANFDMYSIRNTSMRHGLFTEAVTRFSRGQDPTMCAAIQVKAAEMLEEFCGAKSVSKLIDVYDNPRQPSGIVVSAERVNTVLGSENLSPAMMQKTLANIEIDTVLNKNNLDITTPSWRPDLRIPEDIIEEIGRLSGYDSLPVRLPLRTVSPARLSDEEMQRRRLAGSLRSAGAYELLNYSGVSAKLLRQARQDSGLAFTIKNALSPELEFMRLSLTPSLLEKIYANIRQGYEQFALFETGTAHNKALMEDDLPLEIPSIAFIITASKKSSLARFDNGAAYYQGVHWLDWLLERIGVTTHDKVRLEEDDEVFDNDPWLRQTAAPYEPKRRAAILSAGDEVLGVVGEFRPGVRDAYKLPQQAAGFELHRGRLLSVAQQGRTDTYRPLSRFPKVENDVTLKTPQEQPFLAVLRELSAGLEKSDLQSAVEPVDIYQGQEKDSRNLTFRVRSWRADRTLTSDEVNTAIDTAVEHVKRSCGTVRV